MAVLGLLAGAWCAGCLGTKTGAGKGGFPEERASVPTPDIEKLLAGMTLDEKLGQMTQVDWKVVKSPSDVRTLFIGSVLNGGSSLPTPNNPDSWARMSNSFQAQALRTRLGVPLIWGTDAVHGNNGVQGAVIFPHNIGLGASRNPEVVEKVGRVTAMEMTGTGIPWTFSPCIAVPRDERWGRTYEGFGETAELAEMMAAAMVKGLQGEPGRTDAAMACAKHFVGDGGTSSGKDRGDTVATEEQLRAIHLPGYAAAVKAGVASIMVSYSSWNGTPMHANKHLITDVLKGELGFEGFVVTDWEAIGMVPGSFEHAVETAINAGVDMAMVPERYRQFISTLRSLVKKNRVPMARIDDAVRRILKQKARFRIWEHPFADQGLTSLVGSPEHRAVARDAVRQSAVLLKNENRVLPINKKAHVLVAGSKADDLGLQCGGWTVGWNGHRGNITQGTTIYQAIQRVAPEAQIEFSADGRGGPSADVIVVVAGEDPYAESTGDRRELSLPKEDRDIVTVAKNSGKKVVLVLVTGRPIPMESTIAMVDAFLVVWLPGTEGDGVADVLFGDYKPTGKLPHTWPKTSAQIPINHGDQGIDPQYPYGFGLTY